MKDDVRTWDTLTALQKKEEVSGNKLKKARNQKRQLGSQMDRSTDEVDVMFMEGRILGKY